MRLALFPTQQEDISMFASRTSGNVIREQGILGQNVADLQWSRIRLFEATKMMGRSSRDGAGHGKAE